MKSVVEMEWRQCRRFPDYEISECGDLRRLTDSKTSKIGRRLRGSIDMDGYLRYNIENGDGFKQLVPAYRLVAEAFLGPPPSDKHEVAHNNGSRISCHCSNLRWATRLENNFDRLVHDTWMGGENNPRATITESDVRFIRNEYRAIKLSPEPRSVSELEKRFSLTRASIVRIATGKAWKHIPMDHAR